MFALGIENILQAMRGDGGDRGRGDDGGGKAAVASVDIRMHVRNFAQMYLHAYMAVCTYEYVCVCVTHPSPFPLAIIHSRVPVRAFSPSTGPWQ